MKPILLTMVLLCALMMGATPALAQKRNAFALTDAELAVLPPHCFARLKGDAASKKLWEQRMGREIFLHVHHHCFGVAFMSRARVQFDAKQRAFALKQAVRNFNYVLERWPANLPLAVEARNYKMQAEAMLAR